MYRIHMGIPEMEEFWNNLSSRIHSGNATKNEEKLYKKLGKAFLHISQDPRYSGLKTHEIAALSRRYGQKVWQSYLENNTPAAGRIFWSYGPERGDITIIGLEPHPDDKSDSYDKVTLSSMGNTIS